MKKKSILLLLVGICIGFTLPFMLKRPIAKLTREYLYYRPYKYRREIKRFKEADKKQFPPENAVVVAGSSSIQLWHKTIHEDLAPLTVIPRGFGGSTIQDVRFYLKTIITRYKPRAIVLYAGENDLALGRTPEFTHKNFSRLIADITKELPAVRIYYISVKPSPGRWALWKQFQETNRLIKETCDSMDNLHFFDITNEMLSEKGIPKFDIYQDMIHMNRDGYIIWTDIIKPVLLMKEESYEQP